MLHSAIDAIVSSQVNGRRTAGTVTGVELVLVPGALHGFNAFHAAESNAALLGFLAA